MTAIRSIENDLAEDDYRKINPSEQKELACILTAYFEDVISQTGIFQAFSRVYQQKYGKPLPFYSLDSDYTPGEINTEDIQFLIWHYHMQLNNLDIAYSPALDTFAAIAADVMELFEAEYETAPENEKLLHYLQLDEKEQHNLTKAAMKGFVNDEMVARNEEIKLQLKNLHNRRGILASQLCEVTEDDIVGFMMHGFDRTDEDVIFGAVVREAYLFEDCVLLRFNFRDEVGDLAEIRFALEAQKKCEPGGGFALCSRGVPGKGLPEPIPLPGGFGIIIPLRRAA